MLAEQQRQRQKGQSGGQLLHGADDDGMSPLTLPPLINGSERPARHSQLQHQESIQQTGVDGVRVHVRHQQQGRPSEADQHAQNAGQMQRLATGQQRFGAHHPEWRDRYDQASQAARHPRLPRRPGSHCRFPAPARRSRHAAPRSRPRGSFSPRRAMAASMSEPEIMKRAHTSSSGGNDSSDMRMPR